MKVQAKFDINSILKTFVKYRSDIKPKAIYKIENGFLIFAPAFDDEIDYSNPYYFLDIKNKTVQPFNMKYHKQMFDAIEHEPIWGERG